MATFQDAAKELGRGATVIIYDRSGYGSSEATSGPHDARKAERELSGVLAASGVAGPYVLVGHSLGGLYAEYYAAKHSEQIAGLVLEESRPADFSRRCEPILGKSVCTPSGPLMWLMPRAARDEAGSLARVEEQVERVRLVRNKPVLVLSRAVTNGDRGTFDALWAKAQAALAGRYPASRHLSAPTESHYVHRDGSAWFIARVREFLALTAS